MSMLREILKQKGMKATELAEKLGVTQMTITYYCDRDIRTSTAIKIAKALDVSLDQLMGLAPLDEPTDDAIEGVAERGDVNADINTMPMHCPHCGHEVEVMVKLK